jgi:uncharacterized protein
MTIRWLLLLSAAVAAAAAVSAYQAEIAAWHVKREAALMAENGWLSLAGLFWLHEGENPFGRDASNEIALPDGPPKAGVFALHHGKVVVTIDGSNRAIAPDSDDVVKVGRLNLFVIRRGDRIGIRLKDPESLARREFHGIESFAASEAWRVTANFVPEPRKIPILNILGQTEPSDSPGYAVFRLEAASCVFTRSWRNPGPGNSSLSSAT